METKNYNAQPGKKELINFFDAEARMSFNDVLRDAQATNNDLCELFSDAEAGSKEEKILHRLYNIGTYLNVINDCMNERIMQDVEIALS